MTVITDAFLATTPLHYWPMNETSGTTAADLCASPLNGTATGLTMGNMPTDVLPPLAGSPKAVLFDGSGSQYITVANAKILGGLNAWSIGAWVYYNVNDGARRAFYGESAVPFVNDWISAGLLGTASPGGPPVMEEVYQADSGGQSLKQAFGVYSRYNWTFMVMTRSGANVELWWDCGRRNSFTNGVVTNTWTDTGIKSRIGASGDLGWPWAGGICNLALWNRVLSEADQLSIFEACTPLTRTPPTRKFFADNAVWNRALDDPANAPAYIPPADSVFYATRMKNQSTGYGLGINASTGPFFTADASTPRQRVRISGGQNTIAVNPMDLWTALGQVPVPSNFAIPLASDRQGQIYATDTDELWEFIQMEQTLTPPGSLSASVGPGGGGALTTGTWYYAVYGATADGKQGQLAFYAIAVTAGQAVNLQWTEVENADHYVVMRAPSATNIYRVIDNAVPNLHGWQTFSDTGAIAGVPYDPPPPNAVTTDWGCVYGGYLADTDNNLGYYPANHNNWGSSATSIPLWAGAITIHEMQTGVIPHVIGLGLAETDPSFHVFPAQRNDGFGGANAVPEGLIFQLDPAFDVNTIPYKFERMVAVAMQKYGAMPRDTTGRILAFYAEQPVGLGRNVMSNILEGRYEFELWTGFPWDQCKVVDPAWVQAQTLIAPGADNPKIATLVDAFDQPTIDPARWPLRGGSSIALAAAHLETTTSYTGALGTTPNAYELTNSALYFMVRGVPTGDASSEAGVTIANSSIADCYVEMVYADGGKLVCGYNSSTGVRTRVVQPTYVNANHVWWRIRHTTDTIYWETSPDGTTWNVLGSVLWSATGWTAPALDSMTVKFFAGNFGGHAGNPDLVIDNVNVAPVAPPSPPPASSTIGDFFIDDIHGRPFYFRELIQDIIAEETS